MGLSIFDCEICGYSPYLIENDDNRILISLKGKRLNVCPLCVKLFDNPSIRSLSSKQIDILINRRRRNSEKEIKKWLKWLDGDLVFQAQKKI